MTTKTLFGSVAKSLWWLWHSQNIAEYHSQMPLHPIPSKYHQCCLCSNPTRYETTCIKLFPLLLDMCSTLSLPPSLHKFLELSYLPPSPHPPHSDPFHSKSTSSFSPLPHCIPRLCKARSHLFISFPTSRPQTTVHEPNSLFYFHWYL